MTTALYRRYRPDTFDDVIGQEHVTNALKTALSTSRVAHAFLFSGPRGCGKTTSARILARSLNCHEGPTATPCGVCPSCVELATGGPGSLDVVEIDAASNSGVEEARELRERVAFAPTRDRYRIFILDEAHMVTPQGFNALLKVVEEPPEHAKFIFATTEPDKVITTIKSRTHHYPFRLVGPSALLPLLKDLAAQENVEIDEGAYPLIIRAGGGSVRDSLSAMDQLIAGSDGHVTTDQAVHLLGYTDAALLDRTVEALGEHDGAKVFQIVEEVIDAGHEPRQFTMDLLQRLRDMMVCALAGERAADILVEVPSDALALMQMEAQKWGPHVLSSRADTVEAALREMRGTSAPRMQLELLLARLLVEDTGQQAVAAPQQEVPMGVAGGPRTAAIPRVPPTKVDAAIRPEPVRRPPARRMTSMPRADENLSGGLQQRSAPARPDLADAAPSHMEAATSGAPAPTKDEVRERWYPFLDALNQFGGAFRPLLEMDVREVIPVGSTVNFFLLTAHNVGRLKSMRGERHMGQALSQLFGREVGAEVHAMDDLQAFMRDLQAERSKAAPTPEPQAPRPANRGLSGPSSAERAPEEPSRVEPVGPENLEEPPPDDLYAGGPPDELGVEPEPNPVGERPRSAPVPSQDTSPRPVAVSRPGPEPDASVVARTEPPSRPSSQGHAGPSQADAQGHSAPQAERPQVHGQERPQAGGNEQVQRARNSDEDDSFWKGRPPVDVVLGVLGGQVVSEEIVDTDS